MDKDGADEARAKASARGEAAALEEDVFAKQEKLFTAGTDESPME